MARRSYTFRALNPDTRDKIERVLLAVAEVRAGATFTARELLDAASNVCGKFEIDDLAGPADEHPRNRLIIFGRTLARTIAAAEQFNVVRLEVATLHNRHRTYRVVQVAAFPRRPLADRASFNAELAELRQAVRQWQIDGLALSERVAFFEAKWNLKRE